MDINIERVKRRYDELNEIGYSPDEGVNRLALSDADKAARDLFLKWLQELNLDVKVDDLGNMYGIKAGSAQSKNVKPIVIGSHLDSVPNGGTFDGVLGVIAGLEMVETLIEQGVEHHQPVVVANFTNEEGARFPIPMIASGVLGGVYTKEKMYDLSDDTGRTIGEELKKIGYIGEEENRLQEVEAFLELHIEQGPVLEENNIQIGIVNGIQGLSWNQFTIHGEADHAGPSPMATRKDAGITAMRAMTEIHDWVNNLNDGTLVTFGKISVAPHVVNVIPGTATFTVDIRHPNNATLLKRKKEVWKKIEEITNETGCSWEAEELSYMPPVPFHQPFVEEIETVCKDKGYSHLVLPSGAGHDSMYMTRLGPTVMTFVPSIDGKSHNKLEKSRWEDIGPAIDTMYEWTKQRILNK